jgi:hypothetical protein
VNEVEVMYMKNNEAAQQKQKILLQRGTLLRNSLELILFRMAEVITQI